MSLIRKASKKTLRATPEDFTSAMEHKNAMIAALQSEVEGLRGNEERYQRAQEDVRKARMAFEGLLRDQETCLANNQDRMDLTAKNQAELRIQTQHLAEELTFRNRALKEVKFSIQQLREQGTKKEEELSELAIKYQEEQNQVEVKKIEEERTRLLIGQARQEVQKGRRNNALIKEENQGLREKTYKTQAYLRSLVRETNCLNENLTRIEDENSQIEAKSSEISCQIEVNKAEITSKEQRIEEMKTRIASLELQRKKGQKQIKEKVKNLTAEKEKTRSLYESALARQSEANRTETLLKEASDEVAYIHSKNTEIKEINDQLSGDYKVCERHLDNVSRINRGMEEELQNFKEVSLKAITKLQEPFTNKTNTLWPISAASKATPLTTRIKWDTSSRGVAEFETGDFESEGVE